MAELRGIIDPNCYYPHDDGKPCSCPRCLPDDGLPVDCSRCGRLIGTNEGCSECLTGDEK